MSQDPSRRPGAGPGSEGDHLDHVGAMMSHTSIKGIAIVDNVLEGMVWDPQHHQEGCRCTEGGLQGESVGEMGGAGGWGGAVCGSSVVGAMWQPTTWVAKGFLWQRRVAA